MTEGGGPAPGRGDRNSRVRVVAATIVSCAFIVSVVPTLLDMDTTSRRRDEARSGAGPTAATESEVESDRPVRESAPLEDPVREPAWARSNSTVLPPGYLGDVAIRGKVVRKDGSGVEGALVQARPGWFVAEIRPFNDVQADALAVRAGRDGNFEFRDLPRAHNYVLTAVAPHAHGQRTVSLVGVQSASGTGVSIELQDTWSERLRFEDRSGRSWALVGQGPAPLYGPVLYRSALGPPNLETRRALRELGIPWQTEPGEYLIVYSKLAPTLPPGADVRQIASALRDGTFALPRTVQHPDLEPTEYRSRPGRTSIPSEVQVVPVAPRPGEGPDQVYRVVFPSIRVPDDWSDPAREFQLAIAVEGGDRAIRVAETHPTFAAPRERPLVFRIAGVPDALDVVLETSGAETRVTPTIPTLGFIGLHFHSPTTAAPIRLTLHDARSDDRTSLRFSLKYPGYARIGPVPTGSYRIRMTWVSGSGDAGATQCVDWLGPVDVKEGLNVLQWK